jgi:hypothetical protein
MIPTSKQWAQINADDRAFTVCTTRWQDIPDAATALHLLMDLMAEGALCTSQHYDAKNHLLTVTWKSK